MELSETLATGFTGALMCVSVVLVLVRSRHRAGPASVRQSEPPVQRRPPVFSPSQIAPSVAPAPSTKSAPSTKPVPQIRAAASSGETWTILKNDQEIGPVDFNELASYVEQGLVRDSDLLKQHSSRSWIRARDIPGLVAAPRTEPLVSAKAPGPAPPAGRGRLAAEFSASPQERLSGLPPQPVAPARQEPAPDAAVRAAAGPPWRNLVSHSRGMAKALAIVGVLAAIAGLAWIGAPWIIAYRGSNRADDGLPPFALRSARGGREITLSGGITSGAAQEFQRQVGALDRLQLVHLDSAGGRSQEAELIGQIIRARDLSTHVVDECVSACTTIFLSGRERLIGPSGRLGFQTPDDPGLTAEQREAALTDRQLRLDALGVSAEFAQRAESATAQAAWFPTISELLTEQIVTRLVNPFEFALSGMEPAELTADNIQDELLNDPAYAKIRDLDPEQFSKLVQSYLDGLQRGLRGANLIHFARPLLNSIYSEALPYASDEDLVKSLALTVATAARIKETGSPDCYYYLHEMQGGADVADAIEKKFPVEIGTEWELKRQIIANHKGKDAKIIDQQTASQYQAKVEAQVHDQFGSDADVLFGDKIPPDKYLLHCSVAVAYYGAILKLPPDQAAAFFRYLLVGQ